MDKKLLALLILASSARQRHITKIPAGFEVIAQGTAGVYRGLFFGKSLGKYYAMVNLDTVTFF